MKLQFTNGYRPHFDQISRIMQYLLSQKSRSKIPRSDIVQNIGLSDRQTENLISMMTGFGLINSRISTITPLGEVINLYDSYFEKIETLWTIHYIVSSNPEWIVWYRIVNDVIPNLDTYEVEKISQNYFSDLVIHYSERTISEKLPKEVGAVFASYTRTNLSRLNIIEEQKTGNFIKSNPSEIPYGAFLVCLNLYKQNKFPGSTSISFSDILFGNDSPGLVLNLPEYKVREILENLHNKNLIRLEKFANLDQVRFFEDQSSKDTLEKMYGV